MIINCNNPNNTQVGSEKEVCRVTFLSFSSSIKKTHFFFVSSLSLILLIHISQALRKENFVFVLPKSIIYIEDEDGINSKHGRFKEKGIE